ncbi:MAG: hypothetical protein EXS05_22635 [Planctomycetaceae bacterium]|nr:hypothetical protein [Planctomycetaceae bacterium]
MTQNISRRALLVSSLTAVGGTVAAGALAAEGAKPEGAKTDKNAPRNPLTIESLGTMLSALGLKAVKVESRYDFTFISKHGEEWDLAMSVVLSKDEKSVWIMAWLGELPSSSADVPRTALLKLLADNDRIGQGMFFAYVHANRRFVLQRVIRNDNITSASFKADLLELGATVVDTHAHWAVSNWKQLGSAGTVASKEAEGEVEAKSADSRPTAPPASKSTITKTSAKDAAPGGTQKR